MHDVEMVQPEHHRLHHLVNRPAMPLPFVHAAPATTALVGGCGLWVGEAIEETAAAAARCIIGDGGGAPPAVELAPFTLSAGQSRNDFYPSRGVAFFRGLMVQTSLGAIRGTIYVVLMTIDELEFVTGTRTGLAR